MNFINYRLLTLVGCFVLTGLILLLWNALAGDVRARASGERNTPVVASPAIENSGEVAGIAQVAGGNREETGELPQGQTKPESAAVAPTLDMPDHIVKFLNPPGRNVFLESDVRERLSEKDLPLLHSALSDDRFAGQWSDVIFGICVLEDNKKALETVKKFVSTPWDWQSSDYNGDAYHVIRTIMASVRNLGWVAPELSGPFLQEIFRRPGTETFLENWRNVPLPAGMNFEETLINSVRYGAATAMLHSRSPELFKVVEDTFYKLAPLHPSQRPDDGYTMEICKLHLGERDLYNEMGWEKGVLYLCELDGESAIKAGMRLMSKYTKLELELSGRKKK